MKISGLVGACIASLVMMVLIAGGVRAADASSSFKKYAAVCDSAFHSSRADSVFLDIGGRKVEFRVAPFDSPFIIMTVKNGSDQPNVETPTIQRGCVTSLRFLVGKGTKNGAEKCDQKGDICTHVQPDDYAEILFLLDKSLPSYSWIANQHKPRLANGSVWMVAYKDGEAHEPPTMDDWPCRGKKVSLTSDKTEIFFLFSPCKSTDYDYEYSIDLNLCKKGPNGNGPPVCAPAPPIDPRIINRPT